MRLLIGGLIWLVFMEPIFSSAESRSYPLEVGSFDREHGHIGEIDDRHITILGFRLGENTIQDVERTLGQTTHSKSSDHHGFYLCYKSPRERDDTEVYWGTGVMGEDKTLLNFRITSASVGVKRHSERCQKSSLISKHLETASGLKLGMTQEQVRKILGQPMQEGANSLVYKYFLPKPDRAYDGTEICFYVYSDVEVTFQRGEMVSLFVKKIEEGSLSKCQ